MGKVIEVYPGKDEYVRTVKLQVGKKQFVRSIVKVYPLELALSFASTDGYIFILIDYFVTN